MSDCLIRKQQLLNDLIQKLLQEIDTNTDEVENGTLKEHELEAFIEADTVQSLTLSQCDNNKFQIHVTLKWKKGLHLLVTQRNTPKQWASLDRLVQHMNTHYKTVPVIMMELRNKNDDTSYTSEQSNHT